MDINLASLAGNLTASKRRYREREEVAPAPVRKGRLRRMLAAMSVLVAVVGL
jgi:hypothetical protein